MIESQLSVSTSCLHHSLILLLYHLLPTSNPELSEGFPRAVCDAKPWDHSMCGLWLKPWSSVAQELGGALWSSVLFFSGDCPQLLQGHCVVSVVRR